jgi:murein DD-endopeptidase MepM/ murein hydrolase activator NlpD
MMSLRVRAAEPGNASPKFLYQQLPPDAMTLMATIPSLTAALSIPQLNGRHPILREIPPEPQDNIVIVYARKPNGRYEAREILHREESFDVAPFHEIACRWVENNLGGLARIPGRYAYFAPTREQWGVILRDGGFAALHPASMLFAITPEILRVRTESPASGLIARVPVYSGRRSSEALPVAVFAEVELTLDPSPGPECRWISYVQFQKARAVRSRPPESIVPLFRKWMEAFAAESGFKSWSLGRGMFFGDHLEWWGDKNRRRTSHEGIDFVEGFATDTTVHAVREGTPVRAIAAGEVVAILDDFLNKTVMMRHPEISDAEGGVFYTLYSHIHPEKNAWGPALGEQVLGRVGKSTNAGAPAHMHLTGAWIPESIPASEITMDMISASFTPIVLINFNSLL